MSVHVLSWVLQHSPSRLADRLVLLVLADRADRDGGNAYPSLKHVAKEARLSRSQSIASLQRLENGAPPAIVRVGYGPQGQINYTVLMDERGLNFTPPPAKAVPPVVVEDPPNEGGTDSGPPLAAVESEPGGPDPGPLGVQDPDEGGPDPGPEPSLNRPSTVQTAPPAGAQALVPAREGGQELQLVFDDRGASPRTVARHERTRRRLGLGETGRST